MSGGWRRSFRALTWAQSLGALNDNLFKQTIILVAAPTVAVSFSDSSAFDTIGSLTGLQPEAFAGGLFSLPFILFGALGGSLADRLPKSRSIHFLKSTEAALMAVGTAALFTGNAGFLLVVLFLMGMQSAFFGPNKYGVIPEIVPKEQMSRANAVIQATTYGAIIVGIVISGELLDLLGDRFWMIGFCCVVVAVIGRLCAARMEPVPAADTERKLVWNAPAVLVRDLIDAARDRELLIALLLGGLYLHVAGLLIYAIIAYADTLPISGDAAAATRLLGLIPIGLVAGSALAHKLSRTAVQPGLAVIGMIGVSACIASLAYPFENVWAPSALLFAAGTSAGLYLVPLRTIVQLRPPEREKGRFMGTAQVIDFAAFLAASVVWSVMVGGLGLSPHASMLLIGVLTAIGGTLLFASSRLYVPGLRTVFSGSGDSSAEAGE